MKMTSVMAAVVVGLAAVVTLPTPKAHACGGVTVHPPNLPARSQYPSTIRILGLKNAHRLARLLERAGHEVKVVSRPREAGGKPDVILTSAANVAKIRSRRPKILVMAVEQGIQRTVHRLEKQLERRHRRLRSQQNES